jgi:hypothetical protein
VKFVVWADFVFVSLNCLVCSIKSSNHTAVAAVQPLTFNLQGPQIPYLLQHSHGHSGYNRRDYSLS